MRIEYATETDSLYIDLLDAPGVDAREVADGVVLDYGADGRLVGIDIDPASARVDLDVFRIVGLPVTDETGAP
jgi:uncharacterized protein YuzE